MKTFETITEAFDWWINNKWEKIESHEKTDQLVNAWRDYVHKKGISEKRMADILVKYGHFKIKTTITYEP